MTETCAACGFDSTRWRASDAATLFGAFGFWWDLATDGVPSTALHERYAQLATSTQQSPKGAPLETVVQLAHQISHFQMDFGRELAAAGGGTPPERGRVDQVNASGGGVPKLPTSGGEIDHVGLAGDRQADRRHHGRPFQALCLWSADVIGELAGAGHPIAAGNAGENLTLSGIDWTALRPGARMRIGSVLAELSFPAVPCAKQARWFTDGDFRRIAHENNPQWVRWYAWVREPGYVAPGDPVVVQP
jgi:MOSC domain-containing protein YiiM